MKKVLMTAIGLLWTLLAGTVSMRLDVSDAATPNGMCLTEPEFTAFNSMTLDQIRQFLTTQGGFLKGSPTGNPPSFTFTDVDGNPTDASQEIYDAAQINKINPQVLLTTLEKEMGSVRRVKTTPDNSVLKILAGWGSGSATARDQIREMGKQLKRDFYDRLSQCRPTLGGWDVDVTKQTGKNPGEEIGGKNQPISVTPESKAVTVLYQYTTWAGLAFGGGFKLGEVSTPTKGRGGNGLFCELWSQFGFERSPGPLTLSPQAPTLSCALATPTQPSQCVSINASGGDVSTSLYSWGKTNGVIAITGVNQQNIKLRPPQNLGENIGGTAYTARWGEAACAFPFTVVNFFRREHRCNGEPTQTFLMCTDSDKPDGGNVCDPNVPCAAFEPKGPLACGERCGGGSGGSCNAPGGTCSGVPASAIIVDQRVAGMEQCVPCDLALKDGVTVTVQDAAGTPVSVPVQIFFRAHQP